jgi:hypothetical protein
MLVCLNCATRNADFIKAQHSLKLFLSLWDATHCPDFVFSWTGREISNFCW